MSKIATTLFTAACATLASAALALETPQTVAEDSATTPTLFKFPAVLEPREASGEEALSVLDSHGSDLLVVNYWATWCGPCVEELPYFIELSKQYPDSRLRVLGISLDFRNQIEPVLIPFIKDRKIPYSNLVLWADPNVYIDQVDPEWGGEIPATFLYARDGTLVAKYLRPLTREELFDAAKEHLPKQ